MNKEEIMEKINSQYGYLSAGDLLELAKADRLCPVLVRCGSGRFTCPAQDAFHFIRIIESSSEDYIRDISLPISAKPAEATDTGNMLRNGLFVWGIL